MICNSCGAYINDDIESSTCPHCNAPLSQAPQLPKKSSGLKRGCFTCGCGCLAIILIFAGLIGYTAWNIWDKIQENLSPNPLEMPVSQLTPEEKSTLDQKLEDLEKAVLKQDERPIETHWKENEFNYLVDRELKKEENFADTLSIHTSLYKDYIEMLGSYKIDEDKYLNFTLHFDLSINHARIKTQVMKAMLGNYEVPQAILNEINKNLTQEMQNSLDQLNAGEASEFPAIIEQFTYDEGEATLVIRPKSKK